MGLAAGSRSWPIGRSANWRGNWPPRRPAAPAPPDWKLESIRTGSGPKALRVHVGDCAMSGGKPLGREEARRMLAEGVEPCPYCNPENPLGMTG
ncbi:DUF6233 domain-containing protein [Streptomyces sp. NPDC058655]|uniref:DUF6233 domain-containing protein n=1 Tax=Streptomyces sp. NPDC058655 TaxID=3346577 RepID=UPI00365B05BB